PGGPPAQTARSGGGGGGWKTDFVTALIGAPGEWQMLGDVSPSVVSHLKKVEGIPGLDKGELEVVSRNSRFVEGRKTRVSDVYARFVPAGSKPAK
ncbi:MAG: hypothetical protein LC687_07645, partial [Actinobacteria bacterium]|nr:hypothetical protein [Actinomycetota bacterium]